MTRVTEKEKRNRAIRLFHLRQGLCFFLVVVFCLMSLSTSPMKPDIPDFDWSFIGFFFALCSAFIYWINQSVGPNFEDNDEKTRND